MRLPASSLLCPAARQRAVTLLELMVAMSLMTVIVLGLYAMFNRTQEALRTGSNEVEVLEAGRTAFEMMVREIEQARTAGTNQDGACGFWIGFNPYTSQVTNVLVDGTLQINDLQMLFFLKREREWKSIAYALWITTTNTALPQRQIEDTILFTNGVATLYRYERTVANVLDMEQGRTNLFGSFLQAYLGGWLTNAYLTNFAPVADGVINFQVRAYSTNGTLLNVAVPSTPPALLANVDVRTNYFATNAVGPAYIEVELGLLDPSALDRARALANTNNPAPVRNFLAQQAGGVHLFRQRIPIRTVTP